jgi:uncharacterized protein (TIGR00251 family)
MPEATLEIRVQPRARQDEIAGLRDGVLVVRVTAPPLDGRANRAVCRLVAKRAGVAPSRVTVIRGERSRDKVLRVEGIAPDALLDALAG